MQRFALILALLAAQTALAGGVRFPKAEQALAMAARGNLCAIILARADFPMSPRSLQPKQLKAVIDGNPTLKTLAAKYVIGVASLTNSKYEGWVDPIRSRTYGRPVSISFFVPGGTQPLLSTGIGRSGKSYPDARISAALLAGHEACQKWRRKQSEILSTYGAKNASDRALLKNLDAQLALATHAIAGKGGRSAVRHLGLALKLVRKDRERLEQLSFEKAEAAFACGDYTMAARLYSGFARSFPKSTDAGKALCRQALAQIESGEKKRAKKVLATVLARARYSGVHGQARSLMAKAEKK